MSEPARLKTDLRTECFVYQLVPGQGPQYDEYHSSVWSEVRDSLQASGITDYSIYRRDDLVISVWTRNVVAPDPVLSPETRQKVQEWDALMNPLLVAFEDEHGQPLFADLVYRL